MRQLYAFILVAALACAPAALAQPAHIIVNISGVSADLATQLHVDVSDLPASVELAPAAAALACRVHVQTLVDTCIAVTTTTDLVTEVQRELSSKEFVPRASL